MNKTNIFLKTLLSLQQDGTNSISVPSQWGNRSIPLEVETALSVSLKSKVREIMNKETDRGRWHFLLGSPGNGKSTLLEIIFQTLKDDFNCTHSSRSPHDEDQVEYSREIRLPSDRKNFSRLWLIQDASNVKDPYAKNINQASELATELKAAYEKGVSVIVCANRGILERVYEEFSGSDEPWFQAIKNVYSEDNEKIIKLAGKKPYKEVIVSFDALDLNSILIDSDDFLKLFEDALKPEKWFICQECDCKSLCPFFNNQKSLSLDSWKKSLFFMLRAAEIWSAQPIVFREAASLLGYFLAGCPSDYDDCHPCDWVANQIDRENYFGLLSRRVYYQVFSCKESAGLNSDPSVRSVEIKRLRRFADSFSKNEAINSILALIDEGLPSTDVGTERLLGGHKVFSNFDPLISELDNKFRETWSTFSILDRFNDIEGLCPLDKKCFELWVQFQELCDQKIEDNPQELLGTFDRWSSAFLIRLGGFLEYRFHWQPEIDEFLDAINKIQYDPDSTETFKFLRHLGKQLTTVLNQVSHSESETVRLSECLSVGGDELKKYLLANASTKTSGPKLSLGINFLNKNKKVDTSDTYLTGNSFSWLMASEKNGLYGQCIPTDLLKGFLQSRGRAIAMGKYSLEQDGLTVVIDDNRTHSTKTTFERVGGRIISGE